MHTGLAENTSNALSTFGLAPRWWRGQTKAASCDLAVVRSTSYYRGTDFVQSILLRLDDWQHDSHNIAFCDIMTAPTCGRQLGSRPPLTSPSALLGFHLSMCLSSFISCLSILTANRLVGTSETPATCGFETAALCFEFVPCLDIGLPST